MLTYTLLAGLLFGLYFTLIGLGLRFSDLCFLRRLEAWDYRSLSVATPALSRSMTIYLLMGSLPRQTSLGGDQRSISRRHPPTGWLGMGNAKTQ